EDRNPKHGLNSDKIFYYEKQRLLKREKRNIRYPIYSDEKHTLVVRDAVPDSQINDRMKRLEEIKTGLNITDERFDKQWYLYNIEKPGVDINVTGITGTNVIVGIPDDGLYHRHRELIDNYRPEFSYNFIDSNDDPTPTDPNDTHVAVSVLPILLILITIYCWGPADTGNVVEEINAPSYKAIIKGINEGRNGLGSIYVFGAGNGGYFDDCNYDGYANSPYTIAIAAIDINEGRFYFSEPCSAILASTYSGDRKWRIYTPDLGESNPNLTWRDIQHLIVTTAVLFNPTHEDWEKLPSGRYYSNHFGFGKLDAYAFVQAAKNLKSLNPQVRFSTPLVNLSKKFSENNGHITSTIDIHEGYTAHYGFKSLEYVGVSFPSGITSILAHRRSRDKNGNTIHWTFFTAKHWGEPILGEWILSVKDDNDITLDGEVYDWQLHFFGESVSSTKTQTIEYPVTTRYPSSIPSPGPSPSSAPSKPEPPPPQLPPGSTYTSSAYTSLSSSSYSSYSSSSSRSMSSSRYTSSLSSSSSSATASSTATTSSTVTASSTVTVSSTEMTSTIASSSSSSLSSSSSSATTSSTAMTSTIASSKTKTKTTQKPSATSTEGPPYYSKGSQITFFKKNALFISVFSVLIVFIIFGHSLPPTPNKESPNVFQKTEKAAILNDLFITSDSSDIDDSDIMYERHINQFLNVNANANAIS
ncbi:hypothetical protein MERGE_001472, partial [Pneumocystis wakefieldiae]